MIYIAKSRRLERYLYEETGRVAQGLPGDSYWHYVVRRISQAKNNITGISGNPPR